MSYFLISLKNSFVYRSSVLFGIVGSVFAMLLQIALWVFVYQHDEEKLGYMITYVILSGIIRSFYSGGMSYAISAKVSSGAFSLDLIKPNNFIAMHYFNLLGGLCSGFITQRLPVIVIFLPLLIANVQFNSLAYILCAVIAVIASHFMYIVIYSLIGFMSFIFVEIWPFERLMNDTIRFLSGSFIPLALFPDWLGAIANMLPFRFMYSFPIELLIGEVKAEAIFENFIVLFAWLAILFLILMFTYKRAINRCTVQGG